LAKPNYQFEKRQRDLAKKKKKEEKAKRKAERANAAREPGAEGSSGEAVEGFDPGAVEQA
jgi:hypothetical protein